MMRANPIQACSAVGAAAYYTKYLTDASGEVPGVWGGAQAAALGLAGEVTGDELLALLEGFDPVSGAPLSRPVGERKGAVAGYDLTYSAPKSLSVMWALTQDERLVHAHDTAVASATRHFERFGSTMRIRTANGRLHPDSHGLIFASFRQTTSRADDPQIHTHVVVSNKVQNDDGRWYALDAQYLMKHARVAGAIYQSVLRNELAHELGVAWKPIVKGQAEMLGMPPELLAEFSKRTEQIDRAVAAKVADFRTRQGRDPNHWEHEAIEREAAEDTRCAKTGNGVPDLLTRWQDEAAAVGWDAPALWESLRVASLEAGPEPDRVGRDAIVAELSTAGSTWNRAQVMWALCDAARPQASLPGDEWYEVLERVVDQVVAKCVELDPADTSAPRRRSDGRSMWLPPVSPHFTTEPILREEEFVLTWALDAQPDPPSPSSTVRAEGLDVLQASAAAAVAGSDRLVLVVGPAGVGKTTMLRAAVDDLTSRGCSVFGVAPSAKAARVLERETGVRSDTLAKLLWEWSRDDGMPGERFQLPVGTTVLVDEAGMVSTPSLARLVTLAAREDWRLALVGDHRQLQAVGRGGLFHELCQSGVVHELARIHRFRSEWEAAASLQLRQGDPRACDAYIEHGRVHPGSFEAHLATIAEKWFAVTAAGGRLAVVCSTNDHVDVANAAIQSARLERGDLGSAAVRIGRGERAMVGDVVATRRNDRTIKTTTGEPIRNRELWEVSAIGDDGSLTVSAIGRHGTAVVRPEYARQHVRLGYAATEHGHQGDTVTVGLELASPMTTCRGLYSGATRGTDENHILVVTETNNLEEARTVLEAVLASDRADIPAVAQRRELTQLDRAPRPARKLEPRCEVPDWFEDLRARVSADLTQAEQAQQLAESERAARAAKLAAARADLDRTERALDPHRPALDRARAEVESAEQRWRRANIEAARTKGRHHRAALRESKEAKPDLEEAQAHQAEVKAAAAPERAAVKEATKKLQALQEDERREALFDRWVTPGREALQLKELSKSLDDWKRWAEGQNLPPKRLESTLLALSTAPHPGCDVLAGKLAPAVPTPKIEPPTVDLGISL